MEGQPGWEAHDVLEDILLPWPPPLRCSSSRSKGYRRALPQRPHQDLRQGRDDPAAPLAIKVQDGSPTFDFLFDRIYSCIRCSFFCWLFTWHDSITCNIIRMPKIWGVTEFFVLSAIHRGNFSFFSCKLARQCSNFSFNGTKFLFQEKSCECILDIQRERSL
jgi:hypothetical protein